MEFNDREKTILVITTYLSNPITLTVPVDVLALGLQVLLQSKKITISQITIKDYIDAIRTEQRETMKEGFGTLAKLKDDRIV